jgi:hypothetical protein
MTSNGGALPARADDESIDLSGLRGTVHVVATFSGGDAK